MEHESTRTYFTLRKEEGISLTRPEKETEHQKIGKIIREKYGPAIKALGER